MSDIAKLVQLKKYELITERGDKKISIGDYLDIKVQLKQYENYLRTEVLKS